MCCYIVPLFAAAAHYVFRKKVCSFDSKHQSWLTLLLSGGAMFGVIDHLWNGELFLLGPNLASDMLLGLAITVSIAAAWYAIVAFDKLKTAEKVVA